MYRDGPKSSRGSLAWLWRQTHNLESMSPFKGGPEVAGSNPAPGTNKNLMAPSWSFKEKGTEVVRRFICSTNYLVVLLNMHET